MTTSFLYRTTALLAVILGMLGGCVQPPERPSAEPIASTAKREKLALDLQEKGDLAEALVQWNILSTIDPANDFYRKQAGETRQLIDARCKSLLLEGAAHLNRGAREAARTSFLKALALNPRNKEAFDYLRQMSIQFPVTTQNNAKPPAGCCRNRNMM